VTPTPPGQAGRVPDRTFHHQTLRLSRGAHRSPADGACAVELAALLAGEPFGDRPATVSPTIAAFVRGYNDGIDDERRQDLVAVAAELPGTAPAHESAAAEPRRRALCSAWARVLWGRSRAGWLLRPRCPDQLLVVEAAGRDTASRVRRGEPGLHEAALRFVLALTRVDFPGNQRYAGKSHDVDRTNLHEPPVLTGR
jgi:hypothetical protein